MQHVLQTMFALLVGLAIVLLISGCAKSDKERQEDEAALGNYSTGRLRSDKRAVEIATHWANSVVYKNTTVSDMQARASAKFALDEKVYYTSSKKECWVEAVLLCSAHPQHVYEEQFRIRQVKYMVSSLDQEGARVILPILLNEWDLTKEK